MCVYMCVRDVGDGAVCVALGLLLCHATLVLFLSVLSPRRVPLSGTHLSCCTYVATIQSVDVIELMFAMKVECVCVYAGVL